MELLFSTGGTWVVDDDEAGCILQAVRVRSNVHLTVMSNAAASPRGNFVKNLRRQV